MAKKDPREWGPIRGRYRDWDILLTPMPDRFGMWWQWEVWSPDEAWSASITLNGTVGAAAKGAIAEIEYTIQLRPAARKF